MPASLKRIRENMHVEPTAEDAGLKLIVTVVAYDTGIVMVDGKPMQTTDTGWTDAAENLMAILNEFHRQAIKRTKDRSQ